MDDLDFRHETVYVDGDTHITPALTSTRIILGPSLILDKTKNLHFVHGYSQ